MPPNFSKKFTGATAMTNNEGKGFANIGNSGQSSAKKPDKADAVFKKKKTDVRYVISVVIFSLSIIGVGLMFGLNAYYDREISSLEAGLSDVEDVIKIDVIEDLALFSRQILALKSITTSRAGYSILLREVSKPVVPGARYTGINIFFAGASDGRYDVTVEGVADSLETYYQQIESIMVTQGLLDGANFSRYILQHGTDGNTSVNFSVQFDVPLSEIESISATG